MKNVNLNTVSKVFSKAMVDQEFKTKLLDKKIDNKDIFKEHDIEMEEHLRFEFEDLGDKFDPNKFEVKIRFEKQSETDTLITFLMPLPTNPVAPVKIIIGDDEVILTCCC